MISSFQYSLESLGWAQSPSRSKKRKKIKKKDLCRLSESLPFMLPLD